MNISDLDKFENKLISEYKKNTEKTISKLSDEQFKEMLLQRRWTSYAFTVLYDFGIDSISNERAKEVLRTIRNDEYPSVGPSHREDLVSDLLAIGMKKDRIINTPATKETQKIIKDQLDFLRILEEDKLHDIKVITFLRFSLEVLASAEYEVFIKRLEKMGLNKKTSRFYWPHYEHDMKKQPLGKKGRTHSDEIASILCDMLDSEKKVILCRKFTAESCDLRGKFFGQFK